MTPTPASARPDPVQVDPSISSSSSTSQNNHWRLPAPVFMSIWGRGANVFQHNYGLLVGVEGNHPSAANLSNEVDGDCSWNPESPFVTAAEPPGRRRGTHFHYQCASQCISMHCVRGHLHRAQSETRGFCLIYTLLAEYQMETDET